MDPEKDKEAGPVVAGVKGEAVKAKVVAAKAKAVVRAVGVRGAWPPGWAENVSVCSVVIVSPMNAVFPVHK